MKRSVKIAKRPLKKSDLSFALLSLMFFWFMHPFSLRGAGYAVYILKYVAPFCFLLFFRFRYARRALSTLFRKRERQYAHFFLLFSLWALVTISFNGSNDLSFYNNLLSVLRVLLYFLFLSCFLKRYPNLLMSKTLFEQFMTFYIIGNVLYVSFTLILVAFPAFKGFWFRLISLSAMDRQLLSEPIYQNRIGIDGFAGYRNAFSCAVSMIFSLFLSEAYPKERKKYIFFAVMCVTGNVFYGRSGLAVSIVCALLYAVWYQKINFRRLIKALLIAALIYFLGSAFLVSKNASMRTTLSWAFNPLIELATTGKSTNYSFNHMMYDMTFMPPLKTLLIGDGYYTEPGTGHYYMRTDLGFMRVTLFGGLPACVLIYGTVLFGILSFRKQSGYLVCALALAFCAFEFKGDIWYSLMPLLMILTILERLERNAHAISKRYYERLS